MNTTHLIRVTIVLASILMMQGCRSSKHLSSTSKSTTTITSQKIDSAAQAIHNTRKSTTTITFLPMQTPGQLRPATPDNPAGPMPAPSGIPAPVQDIANALMEQGGGTIIITQEESTQNDTTTVTQTTTHEQTQNTSENHETQMQSNQSRASPVLDKILYILIAAAILILVARCRIKQ